MPPRSRSAHARQTATPEAPVAPQRRQAVLYARVSSKDQEREGFSIPAQQRLLHDYADRENFTIMEEFIDVETAKKTGRTNFVKMLAWLKRNRREAAEAGLVTRRTRNPPNKTDIYRILRNPIFVGDVVWRGETHQGIHAPLVSRELWDKVQAAYDGRYQSQHEGDRRDGFAYAGLIVCGHCGCTMTAEIKKEKYVYYHCTGFKGDCGEPYVREEVLTEAFGQALKVIALPGPAMDWLVSALRKSHGDQQRFHAESVRRLEEECARLQRRLDAMYLDKLDGVIDNATYSRNAQTWNEEIRTHRAAIARHENANRVYIEEGVMLLTLAQEAYDLFLEADGPTRRKMLGFLVSNSSWRDGKLSVIYRKPYDFLAELHDQIDPSDPSGGTSEGGPLQTPGQTPIEPSGSTQRGPRL